MVAGIVGRPVAHSLSPVLHNAWIAAAGIDAAYVPFAPGADGFGALVQGLRGGVIRGLNVTLPFKAEALALADLADAAATAASAANLLLFHVDGMIEARNTDGIGLLAAFREQAPAVELSAGPVVVLGAGGAAQGAVAALASAGVSELRVVNRARARAEALAERFGAEAFALEQAERAFIGAVAIINATSAGFGENEVVAWPLHAASVSVAVMDMVYKPLLTPLLADARTRGMTTVDGLAMLIGQARPSFEALFGQPPPTSVDARSIALAAIA
jgi:shikimate dehydrogenase